jgi:heme-degrading monooxygenase HmoA
MFARVTQFEIDTVRISLDDALARFTEHVVPVLKRQPGYEGGYVMRTPEGSGMLFTLWSTAAAADAAVASGFYDEQIATFTTFMRQTPGREQYEVVYAEAPATVSA